jgi:hypothetical protein
MSIYNNDRDQNEMDWEKQTTQATKRVTIQLTIYAKIDMKEDANVEEVLENMYYDLSWPEGEAELITSEILDQEVVYEEILKSKL